MKTTKADPKARFRSDCVSNCSAKNRSGRKHIDKLATLAGSKLDGSFGESEERVISTTADILARVNTCAALAHDDGA
jgi:hypothetical protein